MRRVPVPVVLGALVTGCLTLQLAILAPATALTNRLDANTATLEGGLGHWTPWFSSTVSQSAVFAHTGSLSLTVGITAPHGWGVQLDNAPGFSASPGSHWISFWGHEGIGAGISATMFVDWRRASGTVLRTDSITLDNLNGTWRQASAVVVAPPGTVSVTVEFAHASGGAGDRIYLDDIVVAPVADVASHDTTTLEGSIGNWVPWFSSTVARSDVANGGNFGLKVDITAPFGWGAQLNNAPGFAAAPGPKAIGFSARASKAGLGATMTVEWRTAAGALISSDTVTLASLSPHAWQRASKDVTAPAGTAFASITLSHASGTAGDIVYLDDIVVAQL